MTIPPKCEDLYLKVAELERRESDLMEKIARAGRVSFAFFEERDAALAREAALREELESIKASVDGYDSPEHAAQVADEMGHQCDALQQRVTVVEQRESLLKDLLTNAYIAINTMEPGFYLLEKIDAALKPAETLFEKGLRLFREGRGSSNLWGVCSNDAELAEVHRGWTAAYADVSPRHIKPAAEGEGS